MNGEELLIIGGRDIEELLAGREDEIVSIVERAYLAHRAGKSFLPHSTFLRFPDDQVNRIIALPAFLGGGFDVAGLKWISSFPENVRRGMARASAILILNNRESGRPEVILESSLISARRTAASAALGARALLAGRPAERVGLIGNGLINLEIARFLHTVCEAERFLLYDLDADRASHFGSMLRRLGAVETATATSLEQVLASCPLISFATTASRPYVTDLSACSRGTTILHISLRDLSPDVILGCDNVVDDPDHVCRAQTSLHLAEQATGDRDFIRCTLADLLSGAASARRDEDSIAVFSPFGLGIRDVALGQQVTRWAHGSGLGQTVESFFPTQIGFSA